MTIDQTLAHISVTYCANGLFRAVCWHGSHTSIRCVGYSDGEFRYCLGHGKTWEEAIEDAEVSIMTANVSTWRLRANAVIRGVLESMPTATYEEK